MNYRHIYHAGNFADVVKHAVVARLVVHLARKDKPFRVMDTHAGIGVYDLTSAEAAKTGEHRDGIGRILAAAAPPEALAPYLKAVRAVNGGHAGGSLYPGSPKLVRALMRPGDRLVAAELHPADAAALAAAFRGDRQTDVRAMDGYAALKALLPPPERRGLVLIDPPFETKDEFARIVAGLALARRRFATGIYAVWYPIKDRAPAAAFQDAVRAAMPSVLAVELLVRRPDDPFRLNGCGLLVINPPWTLADELAAMMPFLTATLAQAEGADWRMAWVAPPLS